MTDQADFYGAEPAIIARLKAVLIDDADPPLVKKVASAAALAGSVSIAGICPCVFVSPGPTEAIDTDVQDDGDAPETQTWRIVLVVAAVPDHSQFTTTSAQLDGGLMLKIKQALIGFKPFDRGVPLTYAGRPEPDLGDGMQGIARFFMDFKLTAMP